jgi:hypothetical protein
MVFTAIILGTACTILSEWPNVEIWRSCSYTVAMPVLPLFRTGLMPLLQRIVPGLAFAIIAYRSRGARRLVR